MKSKTVPKRLCVGCGKMQPKCDLVRVFRDTDGLIKLDITRKKPGRGAYLCMSMQCLQLARKGHRLERSFSCKVMDDVYEELEHELQTALERTADNLP